MPLFKAIMQFNYAKSIPKSEKRISTVLKRQPLNHTNKKVQFLHLFVLFIAKSALPMVRLKK
jgi:hypothetical protein